MRLFLIFTMLLQFSIQGMLFAQYTIPADVIAAISPVKNKDQMLTVLKHFNQPEDSLKFQAACFLLRNMPIHHSMSYYWADSLENELAFNELAYADFNASIRAFDALKAKHGKLHPVPETLPDIETIKADYLIADIDEAFRRWRPEICSFENFCEYVLPYRVDVEPLSDWRTMYYNRFSQFIDPADPAPLDKKIKTLTDNLNLWFMCTYNLEKRNEPLPRLGALQLLLRKKGTCEDVADLSVFALRSMGIPATVDVVPFWATSTNGHVLNSAFDQNNQPVHFDALLLSDSLHEFIREPAKVLRMTYSIQPKTLAANMDIEKIPPYGLLRAKNYKDVTHEYWKTRDLTCPLTQQDTMDDIVYACAFNAGRWKPVWWGKPEGNAVTFTNMCQGAVFLPQYYRNGKMVKAGYPVASGYDKVTVLKPDTATHTVTLRELPGYLKFRAGTVYGLGYYDIGRGWTPIGKKTAAENTTEMVFENVPKNALLLLMPKSEGERKERIFTVSDSGERVWW
jgi:hypothetical protein